MSDQSDDEYYDDPYDDLYLPGGGPEDAAEIAARWRPPEEGNQDAMLAFIREAAAASPPSAALDETMRQVETLPTSADLDALKEQAEALGAVMAGFEQRRFTGFDAAGRARVEIGFDGEPLHLELTQAAVAARSARAVSVALLEAWAAAVEQRDEAAEELNRVIARVMGEGS